MHSVPLEPLMDGNVFKSNTASPRVFTASDTIPMQRMLRKKPVNTYIYTYIHGINTMKYTSIYTDNNNKTMVMNMIVLYTMS